MPKYFTLSIRNLPLGTTAQDVCNHIVSYVPGSEPVIGPIVREAHRAMLYTSATIKQDNDSAARAARERLNGSKFWPRNPERAQEQSMLSVNQDFLGVTTLAEHSDPQFDLFFVHGLGGHAFKTWSTENEGYPLMWPRDLLPNDIAESGLAGRFSTIGYKAQAMNTWSASTTIQKAAENLLLQISTHRPEDSERPMYFSCHSLGGLVVCQALIYAFYKDPNRAELYETYNKVLTKDGKCLVKGITFFGTPFEGSQIADHASKLVKFLGGNSALVDSLKYHAGGLSEIVSQFDQLCNSPDSKIKVLIAYEKFPLYGIKFITKPHSALSTFRDSVVPVGIDGDHRTMIRFPSNHDAGYQAVSTLIVRMIKSTLPTASSPTPTSPPLPPDPTPSSSPTPVRRVQSVSSTYTMPPPYPGAAVAPRRDTWATGRNHTAAGYDAVPEQPVNAGFEQHANETTKNEVQGLAAAQAAVSARGSFSLPIHPPKAVNRANLMTVAEEGREDASPFARLSKYDTVFIIDDSGSMNEDDGTGKSRWETLIESMKYIVDIVCHYDPDGVDVHFLYNDAKDEFGIQDGQRILNLLANEIPLDVLGGGTMVGQTLWMVLQTHLDKVEEVRKKMKTNPRQRSKMPNKLNLIVITDGEAADTEEVEQTIVDAARQLKELKAPPHQIGIQFLQIGKNQEAAVWLKKLDDKLHAIHDVMDIVDTRPFNSPKMLNLPFQKRLEQILLGAITNLDTTETEDLDEPSHSDDSV